MARGLWSFMVFLGLFGGIASAEPSIRDLDPAGGAAIPQTEHFVNVRHPDLSTTFMIRRRGAISNDSSTVLVAFGGTGALAGAYGVGPTYVPVGNRLERELGAEVDFIAVENSLYWNASAGDAERGPIIDRYGTLPAQARWIGDVLRYVAAGIPRDGRGRLTKRLVVAVRSTSAAVFLQMIENHVRGETGLDIVAEIDAAFAGGVLDPAPEAIDRWFPTELHHLRTRPGGSIADELVLARDRPIFSATTWTTPTPIRRGGRVRLPEVNVFVGADDPLSTLSEQVSVLHRLTDRLPQLPLALYLLPSFHSPESSVVFTSAIDGFERRYGRMELMGPVMTHVLRSPSTRQQGVRYYAHPELWHYPGACDHVVTAKPRSAIRPFTPR